MRSLREKTVFLFFLLAHAGASAETLCSSNCATAENFAVYFHGLESIDQTRSNLIHSPEKQNAEVLDRLSKELNLCIAQPEAPDICTTSKKVRCWILAKGNQVFLAGIEQAIQKCKPKAQNIGLIGFSNGGFLLNKLFQFCALKDFNWVLSIGSAGSKFATATPSPKLCGQLNLLYANGEPSSKDATTLFNSLRTNGYQVERTTIPGSSHEVPYEATKTYLQNNFK